MKRSLIFSFLACLLVIPAQARLGETLGEMQKRYGKPESQDRATKNAATWFLEGEEGELIFTATFDAKGKSIGEGLKPVRYAKFTNETVRIFIEMQLAPYRDSKTVHTAKPGEKYIFGGKQYTASAGETVIVDDANDFLIVWTQSSTPMVMAVRSVMMH